MTIIRFDPSEPVASSSFYVEDDLFDIWLETCRECWMEQHDIRAHETVQIVYAMTLVHS
jgi:hypothetical protein